MKPNTQSPHVGIFFIFFFAKHPREKLRTVLFSFRRGLLSKYDMKN